MVGTRGDTGGGGGGLPSYSAIQDVSHMPSLLWVDHLIVTLFQLTKGDNVFDVHCGILLEGIDLVLYVTK